MEDNKLKKYNCHKCGFNSDFIVYFKKHICCSKKCQNCNVQSVSPEWLSQHKCEYRPKLVIPKSKRVSCTGEFSCSECGYSCKSFGLLRLHKNIHYDGLFKCSLCTFVTNFENLYRMHMGEHDKERNIENGREDSNYNSSSHLSSSILSEDSNDSVLRDSQKDSKKLKNSSNDKVYECLFCDFKTLNVRPFGNHLLRTHSREVGNKIENFVGISFSPKMRNSLSPSEVVTLVDAMKGSENICNISGDFDTQSNENNELNSVVNKIRSLKDDNKFKKFNTWTKEDKMEIYWCDIFARNEIFPKSDISQRRRRALFVRGILDREKLVGAPNTLLHSITANIRIGKSAVSLKEASILAKDAENYVKSKEGDVKAFNDLEILFDFKKKK